MKMVEHPNIVNLVEVIDDPESDHFCMGTQSISPQSFPTTDCLLFKILYISWSFEFEYKIYV